MLDPPKIEYHSKRVCFPNPGVLVPHKLPVEVELRKVGLIFIEVINGVATDCIDLNEPGAVYVQRYCWAKRLAKSAGLEVPPLHYFLSRQEALQHSLDENGLAVVRPNVPFMPERHVYVAAMDQPVAIVVAQVRDESLLGELASGEMVHVKRDGPKRILERGDMISGYRTPDGRYWT